ncbi:hypothetical protein Plec18170_008752, partial [Paecilomyces lecythidis]
IQDNITLEAMNGNIIAAHTFMFTSMKLTLAKNLVSVLDKNLVKLSVKEATLARLRTVILCHKDTHMMMPTLEATQEEYLVIEGHIQFLLVQE